MFIAFLDLSRVNPNGNYLHLSIKKYVVYWFYFILKDIYENHAMKINSV